jgi:hypothetical protein
MTRVATALSNISNKGFHLEADHGKDDAMKTRLKGTVIRTDTHQALISLVATFVHVKVPLCEVSGPDPNLN